MYKDTYEGVMRLPCMRAISGTKPPQIETDNMVEQLKQQVAQLEDEIVRLKLLVNTKSVTHSASVMTDSVIVPSITVPSVTVPSVEKENITLVLEVDQFDNAEEEEEEEDEEDEEDEEEDEEDEEEDEEEQVKTIVGEQVKTIVEEQVKTIVEEEQVKTIVEEQEEEDEEQEEEEQEEEEQAVKEESAVKEQEEEDEEELFEIEIDGVSYCTGDEDKGIIYELTADGEVGKKVGYLKAGEPFFY